MQICWEERNRHTERKTEWERQRDLKSQSDLFVLFPTIICGVEHLFLALVVFPYSHNKKDIHWHPQKHSVLDKYHIHTLYMPCTMKSHPLKILSTCCCSSGLVISLYLWQFFIFYCMEVVWYEVCGTYYCRMALQGTDREVVYQHQSKKSIPKCCTSARHCMLSEL